MRKLTITRRKTFVGCAGKMKVYIQDKAGDTTIGEETYSKLGELKNGATETYEIDSSAAKVYVIADRVSKEWCNDCYSLPEGSEDINLSGINCFNPAVGNPFRFDDNDNEETKAARKVSLKKGILFTIVAMLIGIIIGYVGMTALLGGFGGNPKDFKIGEMNITLHDGFEQLYVAGHSCAFDSSDVDVIVDRESYSSESEYYKNFDAEDYANAIISSNSLDASVVNDGGLCYFIYNGTGKDGVSYSFYAYTFKTESSFWLVQFAVNQSSAYRWADKIADWAGSIRFD